MASSGREVVDPTHPADPHAEKDGEPLVQRTTEQQKKAENLRAQEARERNDVSNRSRSQSRRDRRKRIRQGVEDGKYMKTNSLTALEEADANGELQAMQPFERIGPDSTSMDGPVTMARARRGEIPVRGSNPNQPYYMTPEKASGDVCHFTRLSAWATSQREVLKHADRLRSQSELKDTEGLKLTLEANLDIEIELKASIRGDLTLSL